MESEAISQQRGLEISEKARSQTFMEHIACCFYSSEVDQKKEFLSPINFQQIQQTAHYLLF